MTGVLKIMWLRERADDETSLNTVQKLKTFLFLNEVSQRNTDEKQPKDVKNDSVMMMWIHIKFSFYSLSLYYFSFICVLLLYLLHTVWARRFVWTLSTGWFSAPVSQWFELQETHLSSVSFSVHEGESQFNFLRCTESKLKWQKKSLLNCDSKKL